MDPKPIPNSDDDLPVGDPVDDEFLIDLEDDQDDSAIEDEVLEELGW